MTEQKEIFITTTITSEVYNRLIQRSLKLDALECGGVDNWAGYDEAMAEMRGDYND